MSGKKYFFSTWCEILSATLPKCTSEIKIKIIMLSSIKDESIKSAFFENALEKLELFSHEVKNIMSQKSDGFFLTSASILYKECSDLGSTIEKIKLESSKK